MVLMGTRGRRSPTARRLALRAGRRRVLFVIRPARWGLRPRGWARSPAGAQLIMATMDQHLAAMQRQLDQTTAQNRLLALRLRELAAGYRGIGSAGMGGMPLSGLGGFDVGQRRLEWRDWLGIGHTCVTDGQPAQRRRGAGW